MKNKEQFNHNIKKAQRQRLAENKPKTQILNLPGFSNMHTQIMSDTIKYNYDNLTVYVDFVKICKDFKLRAGDISPHQEYKIEQMLREFIKQNSSFYGI